MFRRSTPVHEPRRRMTAIASLAIFAAAASGCTESSGASHDVGELDVQVAQEVDFPEVTMMAELAEQDSVTIGVKFDQPGIGFLEPGAKYPSGYDIEIGKYVAAQLGIKPSDITWKETVSDNREPFLNNGTVDLVIASYSITPERSAVVGQAGPYYLTGQQLLVREEDKGTITGPDDLAGVKVCSVTGSTSLERVSTDYDAEPVPFDTFSACVRQLGNGTVDVVTTDGVILRGYEAQDPDNLEIVGSKFSEERLGIGYPKQQTEMCGFLVEAIRSSYEDGYWVEAFDATLGKAGVEAPTPPQPDRCP